MSSMAAKKVGSNQDLLLQIIAVLPLKPLLRFKSISKTWLSLVMELVPHLRRRMSREPVQGLFLRMTPIREKNHYFLYSESNMQDHMHHYVPLNPIKNRPFSTKVEQPNLPSCPPRGNEIIVLSSSGLFLCYNIGSRRFYVYNPTTLSYTTIPDHTLCYTIPKRREFDSDPDRVGVALVVDPVTSPHYKLIFVWQLDKYCSNIEIGIYSSETGTWSGSGGIQFTTRLRYIMLSNGVFWNGSVHWISDTLDNSTGRRNFIRFHIDTMTIHEFDGPQERNQCLFTCKNYYFGESCGHLHYIESGINNMMDIYEMKTDYSEWFVKYKINLAKEINKLRYRNNPHSFDLISVVRHEDTEERSEVLILWVGNKVIKRNLVNRKFKTLAEFWNGYQPGPGKFIPKRDSRIKFNPTFIFENAFPFIPSLLDT